MFCIFCYLSSTCTRSYLTVSNNNFLLIRLITHDCYVSIYIIHINNICDYKNDLVRVRHSYLWNIIQFKLMMFEILFSTYLAIAVSTPIEWSEFNSIIVNFNQFKNKTGICCLNGFAVADILSCLQRDEFCFICLSI